MGSRRSGDRHCVQSVKRSPHQLITDPLRISTLHLLRPHAICHSIRSGCPENNVSLLFADGLKALELDIVAICDVIRQDIRYDPSDRKQPTVSSFTGIPLVGWPRPAFPSALPTEASSTINVDVQKQCHISLRPIIREDEGSGAGKTAIPSLRSIVLGYFAPFVADLVQNDAMHLPPSIRASLIALARCDLPTCAAHVAWPRPFK